MKHVSPLTRTYPVLAQSASGILGTLSQLVAVLSDLIAALEATATYITTLKGTTSER